MPRGLRGLQAKRWRRSRRQPKGTSCRTRDGVPTGPLTAWPPGSRRERFFPANASSNHGRERTLCGSPAEASSAVAASQRRVQSCLGDRKRRLAPDRWKISKNSRGTGRPQLFSEHPTDPLSSGRKGRTVKNAVFVRGIPLDIKLAEAKLRKSLASAKLWRDAETVAG